MGLKEICNGCSDNRMSLRPGSMLVNKSGNVTRTNGSSSHSSMYSNVSDGQATLASSSSPPSSRSNSVLFVEKYHTSFVERATPKSVSARRKAFVYGITKPSPKRGFVTCRLCNAEIWGPNGRYHIDKCSTLWNARETARRQGVHLSEIGGVRVYDGIFKSRQEPAAKPAKVPGFVVSSSVSLQDPFFSPSEEEIKRGVVVGRKGYVRCVRCNSEIFAPNARNHLSVCHM